MADKMSILANILSGLDEAVIDLQVADPFLPAFAYLH